jgi:hypothetical protein
VSTTRGRVLRPGGMAVDPQGASARTETGNTAITRPAYRVAQGEFQPAGVGGPAGGHPLLDLSSVSGWRVLAVVAALFYIGVFHVTLGRGGVRAGVTL